MPGLEKQTPAFAGYRKRGCDERGHCLVLPRCWSATDRLSADAKPAKAGVCFLLF